MFVIMNILKIYEACQALNNVPGIMWRNVVSHYHGINTMWLCVASRTCHFIHLNSKLHVFDTRLNLLQLFQAISRLHTFQELIPFIERNSNVIHCIH